MSTTPEQQAEQDRTIRDIALLIMAVLNDDDEARNQAGRIATFTGIGADEETADAENALRAALGLPSSATLRAMRAGTGLPKWDQMSDLDKGAAVLHLHKRESEGADYAIENYPARYFDHPALTGLDGEDASDHAATLETAAFLLGPGEYERLYDLADAARSKR